jgi:hypothetical protein
MIKALQGHEWEFVEFAKWDGEPDLWKCTRCEQELRVSREHTVGEAAKESGLENCDKRVLSDVMES